MVPAGNTQRQDELRVLRQEALLILAVPAVAIGWLWLILALNEMQFRLAPLQAVAPLALFAGGTMAMGLNSRSANSAAMTLLLGLAGAAWATSWLHFPGLPPYLFSLVVSVAGLLLWPTAGLVIALPASALIVLAGRHGMAGAASVVEIGHPLLLLWLMASVSYLSTRNLYRAVRWAWESANVARERANEAMVRRGELARALRSLDEMYSLLARAKAEETAAREEAELGRRQKAQFAANVSHELRTPLNLIIGFSELMYMAPQVYGDMEWPAALRSDVSEIYHASLHLQRLIDDILDLAQIEAMRLPLDEEETQIAELIQSTVAMATGLLRGQEVQLIVEIEPDLPVLWIDRTRIRQVLLNLLANAARFTERGTITVSAHAEKGKVHIRVADTDIGMSSEQLSRVFREFEQGDGSLHRRHGGTGLGLAISKQFVELHGGSIWAESELGVGSTFHVTLPRPDAPKVVPVSPVRTPRSQAALEQEAARARTVVLQSQDPSVIRLLGRYVQGYRFVPSTSIRETLTFVAKEHPRAVIVSAESREEADSLAEKLQRRIAPLAVPLISWSVDTSHISRLPKNVEWFPKPVQRRDFLATLARIAPGARNLLVVDDDPAAVQLIVGMIRSAGQEYAVSEAFGGAEALQIIAARPPDVLILDMIMPEIGGLEVLDRVRRDPTTQDLPVLMVTAGDVALYPVPTRISRVNSLAVSKHEGLTTQEWLSVTKGILDAVPARYVHESPSEQP